MKKVVLYDVRVKFNISIRFCDIKGKRRHFSSFTDWSSSSELLSICHQKLELKEPRRPWPRPKQPVLEVIRRGRGEGENPTLSTSTKSWDRFTQTPVFPARPCPSWTASSTTFSKELPPKHPDWPTTTRDLPSHLGRSKPLYVFCCQENWPSTPSAKVQRQSPSTPAPSKKSSQTFYQTALFRATYNFQKEFKLLLYQFTSKNLWK